MGAIPDKESCKSPWRPCFTGARLWRATIGERVWHLSSAECTMGHSASLKVTGKNVAMTAGMTRGWPRPSGLDGVPNSIKRRTRSADPRTRPLPTMDTITYRAYSGEHELPYIISLVQGELSEPYVVYTYRYFLHQWSVPPFLSLNPQRLIAD
jgi:hypothetical protein